MQQVILDANALMMVFQFDINISSELERLLGAFEVVVPSSVLVELSGLSRDHADARKALSLAERFRRVDVPGSGDDAIVDLARDLDAIVVTNDRELRGRLKALGKRSVFMRQGSHLELDW